jgi:hypothetical protein
MKRLLEFFQEESGAYSSIRLALAITTTVFIYLMFLFTLLVKKELSKDIIDYTGLSLLFTTMFINFILVILLKVVQKKFETNEKT